MGSFANGTSVTVEKTRTEIERLLLKAGASQFGCITDIERGKAIIGFIYRRIQIKMEIPIPDRAEAEFTTTPQGKARPEYQVIQLFEGEIRRRWRCLGLALKAKMVSVEDGVTTFEKEFLPYMVTANGETVGDQYRPMIEAVQQGKGPLLALPPGGS